MKLSYLLQGVDYAVVQGDEGLDINKIFWDSRKVEPNSLFICVRNRNVDRHEFALDAINRGALALVIDHNIEKLPSGVTVIRVEDSRRAMAKISASYFGNPSRDLKLIGITGTNGKTSTTCYISSILEGLGLKNGVIGTLENSIGGIKLSSEKLNPTTPDALELHNSFFEMHRAGVSHVVMEVTSSALSQDRVYGCNFEVGVFTNLTQDHLEEHGSMENYKKAKLKLFTMCKTGVINEDDPMSADIYDIFGGKLITYGIDKEAHFRAIDIKYSKGKTAFFLKHNKRLWKLSLKVYGRFGVYNVLAAMAACYALGYSVEQIMEGLKMLKDVPGRFQVVPNDREVVAIVDYAHSPDGLENVLTSARSLSKGSLISVFGCGGNRDRTKRPIMGEIAGRYSDVCIITSDNPRNEIPMDIIEEIESGVIKTNCEYEKIEDRKTAILAALKRAKPGDSVVIAGKGHENYQIFKDETIYFSDLDVVRDYFS